MQHIKPKVLRTFVQASAFLVFVAFIILYGLYTKELIDFRPLGIGDLNPYGGWSVIRELATDSGYTLEGISRSVTLTIALIVLSILGGRFFCGWLCPLGAVQDFFAWMGRRVGVRSSSRLPDKYVWLVWLKYLVLLVTLLISILGFGAIIAGISPWRALQGLPMLVDYCEGMKAGFVLLAAILMASLFITRAFCRYLCPLGAAQALFSSFSLLHLEHGKACLSCSGCMEGCPAGIRATGDNDAISQECIRCMNCLGACRSGKGGVSLKAGSRQVSIMAYTSIMLILFFGIWLGVSYLWSGSSEVMNVPLGGLKDGTYQGEATGFAGKITTEVVVAEGRITEIRVMEHYESKGWYEEVFKKIPERIIEKQRLQADVVSGATKTSRGLVKSIESAVKKAQ